MLINNADWKVMSDVQKKQKILSAYIQNLEKNQKGSIEQVFRIKEAKFILSLLREKTS